MFLRAGLPIILLAVSLSGLAQADGFEVESRGEFSLLPAQVDLEGPFTAKPKVYLVRPKLDPDRKWACRVLDTPSLKKPRDTIRCRLSSRIPVGVYDLMVKVDRNGEPVKVANAFWVVDPVISSIEAAPGEHEGAYRLKGYFLGTINPRLWLTPAGLENTSDKKIRCRILTARKQRLDPETGEYSFTFVPGKHFNAASSYFLHLKLGKITVKAPFNENQYSLKIFADPDNGGSTNPPEGEYVIGGTTLTATPNPGFRFANWELFGNATISDSLSSPADITLSGNTKVTAVFEELPENPEFDGHHFIISDAPGEIVIYWPDAVDDIDPAEEITYHIYVGVVNDLESLHQEENKVASVKGVRSHRVTGLTPGERCYVLVIAEDLDGNFSCEGAIDDILVAKRQIEFQGEVKPLAAILSEDDYATIEISADRLTVSFGGDYSAQFEVGNIVILDMVDDDLDMDQSGLRVVETVTVTHGRTILVMRVGYLEDVVKRGNLATSVMFSEDLPEQSPVSKKASRRYGNYRNRLSGQGYKTYVDPGGHYMMGVAVNDGKGGWMPPVYDRKDGVKILRADIPIGGGVAVKNFELALNPTFDFKLDMGWILPNSMTVKLVGKPYVKADVEFSIEGKKDLSPEPIPLFKQQFITWLGAFYQRTEFGLYITVSYSATGAVTITYHYEREDRFEIGTEYRDWWKWNAIREYRNVKNQSGWGEWEAEVALNASVEFGFRAKMKVYEIFKVEPSLGAELSAKISSSPANPCPSFSAEWGVPFTIAAGLEINKKLKWDAVTLKFYLFGPYPLLSQPKLEFTQGATTARVGDRIPYTCKITPGVNNPVKDRGWELSPSEGHSNFLEKDATDPDTVWLNCQTPGVYRVTPGAFGINLLWPSLVFVSRDVVITDP
jgi:hypothetical protein